MDTRDPKVTPDRLEMRGCRENRVHQVRWECPVPPVQTDSGDGTAKMANAVQWELRETRVTQDIQECQVG